MAQNRFYSSTTKRTNTTVDPGTSGTTLTVVDTTSFSSLDSTFPYTLLINWGLGDTEIVKCTARPSSTTFTIVRGQGGTSGQAHAVGATVDHGVYSDDFNEAGAHVGAASAVHGLSGSVVGTTDTQTLTNKTIVSPFASYSANHTATATESILSVSAASTSVTITLPTAVGITGQTYMIMRSDTTYANTVTVATTSSQTINGSTTYTSLYVQYAYVQVVSDGSNWEILDTSIIPEPWQSMSLSSQWSNAGAGFFNCQYRLLPWGDVEVRGTPVFTANGTTGLSDGATMATGISSGHIPSNLGGPIPCYPTGGSPSIVANRAPHIRVDTSGNVKVYAMTTVTTNGTTANLFFHGIYSL